MKKKYTLISKDTDSLLEMLSLRQSGWTFVALAERYHCDRASLRYHCRKYQVFPIKTEYVRNSREVFNPQRMAARIIVTIAPFLIKHWEMIDGERVNTGKSYAEYLKANSPYISPFL